MKIFTHTYNITIFKGGRFCWVNNGWVRKESITITGLDVFITVAAIYFVLK